VEQLSYGKCLIGYLMVLLMRNQSLTKELKGQGVTPEKAILGDLLRIIHIEQLSREFFGESFTWLHQKLNGMDRQGNPVPPLSPSERATLQMAMKEISKRIMDKAEKLNELN